jgi:hypothetical protein
MSAAHMFGFPLEELLPALYSAGTVWVLLRTYVLVRLSGGGGEERDAEESIEQPGTSCFLRDGDRVFHTYSTYGRGAEMLGGSYYWLDRTALGRQEEWEEPKGRAGLHVARPDFAS